jgi:hypothetical protein
LKTGELKPPLTFVLLFTYFQNNKIGGQFHHLKKNSMWFLIIDLGGAVKIYCLTRCRMREFCSEKARVWDRFWGVMGAIEDRWFSGKCTVNGAF